MQTMLRAQLGGANAARTFLAQALLPGATEGASAGRGAAADDEEREGGGKRKVAAAGAGGAPSGSATTTKPAYDPRKLVRTNAGSGRGGPMAAGELDKYVHRASASSALDTTNAGAGGLDVSGCSRARGTVESEPMLAQDGDTPAQSQADGSEGGRKGGGSSGDGGCGAIATALWTCGSQRSVSRLAAPRPWLVCELTSIQSLLRRVTANVSRGLHSLFAQHAYVGMVDRR